MRVAPTCLSLPLIQVPATFSAVKKPTAELTATAVALVEGGWLTPAMYQAHQGNLAACSAEVISTVAKAARPKPVAELEAQVWDCAERAELHYGSPGTYCAHHKCQADKVGVIVVHGHCDKPVHRLIGPRIVALEKFRPGLGATALYWLSTAFDKTISACDPITGLGWAQGNYWMGEVDERFVLDEQLEEARSYHKASQAKLPKAERKPFNQAEAVKELGILTRAEYHAKIPRWVTDLKGPKLTLEQLSRIRLPARSKTLAEVFSGTPDFIPALINLAELAAAAPRYAEAHDGSCFESMRWEICPFLLRWSYCETDFDANEGQGADPLGMIWDDFVNNEFQGGDTNISAMAAWGFHDGPSLIQSMHRFDRWCRLLQSAETLLNLIQPEDLD